MVRRAHHERIYFSIASLRSTPCGGSKFKVSPVQGNSGRSSRSNRSTVAFNETNPVPDVPIVQSLRSVQDVDEDDSALNFQSYGKTRSPPLLTPGLRSEETLRSFGAQLWGNLQSHSSFGKGYRRTGDCPEHAVN